MPFRNGFICLVAAKQLQLDNERLIRDNAPQRALHSKLAGMLAALPGPTAEVHLPNGVGAYQANFGPSAGAFGMHWAIFAGTLDNYPYLCRKYCGDLCLEDGSSMSLNRIKQQQPLSVAELICRLTATQGTSFLGKLRGRWVFVCYSAAEVRVLAARSADSDVDLWQGKLPDGSLVVGSGNCQPEGLLQLTFIEPGYFKWGHGAQPQPFTVRQSMDSDVESVAYLSPRVRGPTAGMASSLPKTPGMYWHSGDPRPSRRSSFSSTHSEAAGMPGSSAAQANQSARSAFFSAANQLPQPSPQTGPASLHHTQSVPIAAQARTPTESVAASSLVSEGSMASTVTSMASKGRTRRGKRAGRKQRETSELRRLQSVPTNVLRPQLSSTKSTDSDRAQSVADRQGWWRSSADGVQQPGLLPADAHSNGSDEALDSDAMSLAEPLPFAEKPRRPSEDGADRETVSTQYGFVEPSGPAARGVLAPEGWKGPPPAYSSLSMSMGNLGAHPTAASATAMGKADAAFEGEEEAVQPGVQQPPLGRSVSRKSGMQPPQLATVVETKHEGLSRPQSLADLQAAGMTVERAMSHHGSAADLASLASPSSPVHLRGASPRRHLPQLAESPDRVLAEAPLGRNGLNWGNRQGSGASSRFARTSSIGSASSSWLNPEVPAFYPGRGSCGCGHVTPHPWEQSARSVGADPSVGAEKTEACSTVLSREAGEANTISRTGDQALLHALTAGKPPRSRASGTSSRSSASGADNLRRVPSPDHNQPLSAPAEPDLPSPTPKPDLREREPAPQTDSPSKATSFPDQPASPERPQPQQSDSEHREGPFPHKNSDGVPINGPLTDILSHPITFEGDTSDDEGTSNAAHVRRLRASADSPEVLQTLQQMPSQLLSQLTGPQGPCSEDASAARMVHHLLYSSRCSLCITEAGRGADGTPDRLVFVSHDFEMQTGYRAEEVLGRNCRFMQAARGQLRTPSFPSMIIKQALEAGAGVDVKILNYHRNGSAMWNQLAVVPLRSADGSVTHHVGMQTFSHFEDVLNTQVSLPLYASPVQASPSRKPPSRRTSFGKSKSCNDLESIPPVPSAAAIALSTMAA